MEMIGRLPQESLSPMLHILHASLFYSTCFILSLFCLLVVLGSWSSEEKRKISVSTNVDLSLLALLYSRKSWSSIILNVLIIHTVKIFVGFSFIGTMHVTPIQVHPPPRKDTERARIWIKFIKFRSNPCNMGPQVQSCSPKFSHLHVV